MSKNIIGIVEIWKRVVDEAQSARLAIIGSGDEQFVKDVNHKIQNLGMQNNIKLLGFLPDEKAIACLKSSKIFAAASQEEGFGLSVLEAAACGLSIAAYDLPVYQDLQPSMLLAPQNDLNHFALNIINLLSNETMRKKLSGNALKLAKGYSWEKSAKREFSMSF